MQQQYKTNRLTLHKLTIHDADFIYELVNTPGWLKFIGDRNIRSVADAANYIEKIMNSRDMQYWIVKLNDQLLPVGVITCLKRANLQHHDIGFAFLPACTKKGYAFEAAGVVLNDLLCSKMHSTILATTLKDNNNSVQLLKKLGFAYLYEIKNGNDLLDVYEVTENKLFIPV